ncbi:uncharacterized protein LOC128990381 [Macrosteles quadrilineatus]|uniref:uncharacterized protein LOC128990381 n=1 Tax=Macrosteles quadrilineatus TaxID=74068 RepID=UPI0023E332AD|nr:uncharacterized protein LOC128990381 [Macrosteles quadrilineatus]
MIKINVALLFLAVVAAKQSNLNPSSSNAVRNDQEVSNDQVTSILVHPGPNGPRHVILSNEHQVISSVDGISGRAVNADYNYPQTIAPSLSQYTYGPPRPVGFHRSRPAQQPQQLYHHSFRQPGKTSHAKEPQEEAVYKYTTYIKHDKAKGAEKDYEKSYYTSQSAKPDYSVTAEKESHETQHEGLSKYRNRDEKEEIQFRESIGDLYNPNGFEKSSDYSNKVSPQSYSKYLVKNHYIPNNHFAPVKSYQSPYSNADTNSYTAPSGFDDSNGGKVVPILARFYKQPLPIIQTQLPADNVGLFVHYFPSQRSEYEREELSNNFFDYSHGKLSLKRDSSNSEWTPINAPDGAVPAKSYDIPAPDLSREKPVQQKIYRRGSDDASVVVGKSKQEIFSSHKIQGNSEGVVSAVVRVKQ